MLKKIRFTLPTPEEMQAMHERRVEAAKINPTCFTHWFPTVERLGIPHPRSRVIDFPDELTCLVLDERHDEAAADMARVIAAIRAFGEEVGYPLFVKNSLFSGKHEWPNTCYIAGDASDEQIWRQIVWLTNLWGMLGADLALHLVVREFIRTEPVFHAFSGMPVTAEFRLFATDGELNGWQPYWPEGAIQEADVADWAERLKTIAIPGQDEMQQMRAWAEAITRELGGYWSVDFLRGSDGKLYLIDMAEGRKSYKCEAGYQPVATL